MVRLYLIRHGDPDYDTDKANGGSLTEHGKAEATALATFLANEGITHAYSSPMGRAKLTAELGLMQIQKFSSAYNDIGDGGDNDSVNDIDDCNPKKNNFERNVLIEPWCKELSTWRCKDDNTPSAGASSDQIGAHSARDSNNSSTTKKNPAVWDFPAPITRSQLYQTSQGTESSVPGWTTICPDHATHELEYRNFCKNIDELLSRHGIIRAQPNEDINSDSYYYLSQEVMANQGKRLAKIAIFCHNGTALTFLSHLLQIPLPMVHASMWLAPSSVTTILFDEYPAKYIERRLRSKENGESNQDCLAEKLISDIIITPRAICIGGTNHLALAGLSVPLSKYENHERPSGIKHNFY